MNLNFLHAVVDTLLPGLSATETDATLPAASEIGVAKKLLAHLDTHRDKAVLANVLATIAAEAGGEDGFVAGEEGVRTAVLQTVEQQQPDAFATLLFIVAADYYESETVLRAFNWRPTPPQPLGYPLPPFDEGLLEQVRKKRPFWRKT